MPDEIKTFLFDIQQSIREINNFLPDRKNFIEFKNDIKTKRAIERNIEIIGEAVNRILKLDPNFPIKNSTQIVDTRNRFIHGYDTVSNEIIWSIVMRDIPILKEEVDKLLEE